MNEQDFHKLAQDHYDRLFRAARFMCGSDDAAEDLVHETFLAAAQSYGRFQHRSSTYTWLYGIMLNKFRRWLRKKRGRVLSLQRPAEEGDARSAEQVLEAEGDEPPIEAERREAIALVREAVEQLPPDHRSVVAMRFVDGMSYQEIAEVLDCPLGTVKSRIHYALQKVGAMLKDLGPPP